MSDGPTRPAGAVRERAPAKVNLALEVLGRRADGFHEVDLVTLAVGLWDELEARPLERPSERPSERPGVALEVVGPAATEDVRADASNLVWRAAAGVLELLGRAGEGRGVALRLEKHVPSGAGLGGGSSDAAAAVRATLRALGARIEPGRLRALLADLGSDCVFFLDGATTGLARCKGRGERVEPLPFDPRPWHVALLAPDVHCSTARVYAAAGIPLSGAGPAPSFRADLLEGLSRGAEQAVRSALSNRLEQAALHEVPELSRWRDLLDRSGASHFRLSGSGSTFFGMFRDPTLARGEVRRLAARAASEDLALRGAWVVQPTGPFGAEVEDAAGPTSAPAP